MITYKIMPCDVCGSKTNTPKTQSHLKSKRHQKANSIVKKDARRMFKIVVIGGQRVGKSTFIRTSIGYTFNSGCTLGALPIKFEIYRPPAVNLKSTEQIVLSLWDIQFYSHYQSFIEHLFREANFAIIIFDITRFKSYQDALYWLMIMVTYRRLKIPFVIVGNKADLENSADEEITSAEFGEKQSIALTYMFNLHVGYLHTSALRNQENMINVNKDLLESITEFLIYTKDFDPNKLDEHLQYSLELNHKEIACFLIPKITDKKKLHDIIWNESYDLKIRVVAFKRLSKLDKDEIPKIIGIKNKLINNLISLFTLDQQAIYLQVLTGDHPLIRTAALELLMDQEKLLEIAFGHQNPVYRLHALSKLDNEDYYDFIYQMYEGDEIQKNVLVDNIVNEKFFLELISQNADDLKRLAKAVEKISNPKYLQILRLMAPNDLQPLILTKLQELSQ